MVYNNARHGVRLYSPLMTIVDAIKRTIMWCPLEKLQWHTPIIHDVTALNKTINHVQTAINMYRKQQQKRLKLPFGVIEYHDEGTVHKQ
jgi:hypothetical protein